MELLDWFIVGVIVLVLGGYAWEFIVEPYKKHKEYETDYLDKRNE